MGNCLRLGISRIGLAWSKWRMAAKFKKKSISVVILGMQAVGKSTIALRLYKFKRALPDMEYVQTKGFHTYSLKQNKTTVNIYDLGGHESIQELWGHYYADAHGIIYVVDTSDRDTLPEAGRLLAKVLSDRRIRGKPVLLLANKIDLDGVTENELDTMLNLQQIVNSARCLTRLDVSCATDLKNDKGIFEGFKWLISYIEANFVDINNRVLSDTMEEKNQEKTRREAIKAARLAEKAAEEEAAAALSNGTPVLPASPSLQNSPPIMPTPPRSAPSRKSIEDAAIPNLVQETEIVESPPRRLSPERTSGNSDHESPPESFPVSGQTPPKVSKTLQSLSKIPLPLLPPINTNPSQFVEQPIKLPRIKSPKSRPEIINRIEDHESTLVDAGGAKLISKNDGIAEHNDQYYNEKEFRFRRISAARRLSPEGADSDDGIVNLAYEPTEDISSDSTPIGVRRHHFANDESDYPNKELFMVTTLAEVHKEYFKDRKGSTSTHDSISMSVASEATDSIIDDGQSINASLTRHDEATTPLETHSRRSSISKGKSKKRLGIKPRSNKTAPLIDQSLNLAPISGASRDTVRNFSPSASLSIENQSHSQTQLNGLTAPLKQSSRTSSASSKASSRAPFTVASAWERSTDIPEDSEMSRAVGEPEVSEAASRY